MAKRPLPTASAERAPEARRSPDLRAHPVAEHLKRLGTLFKANERAAERFANTLAREAHTLRHLDPDLALHQQTPSALEEFRQIGMGLTEAKADADRRLEVGLVAVKALLSAPGASFFADLPALMQRVQTGAAKARGISELQGATEAAPLADPAPFARRSVPPVSLFDSTAGAGPRHLHTPFDVVTGPMAELAPFTELFGRAEKAARNAYDAYLDEAAKAWGQTSQADQELLHDGAGAAADRARRAVLKDRFRADPPLPPQTGSEASERAHAASLQASYDAHPLRVATVEEARRYLAKARSAAVKAMLEFDPS